MPNQSTTRLVTGQQDWSGGVDSNKPPTIASEANPHGLRGNQLYWAVNCTMRGGSIQQRYGWIRRAAFDVGIGRYQGGLMYQPRGNVYPYIVCSIAGQIYRVRVDRDDYFIENISSSFFESNPATPDRVYMAQGEEFVVIQAGDFETLPLFFDGVKLWRSRGPVPSALAGGTFTVPAIGSPVLMTGLTAPYVGAVNEIFTIDGFQYQQVDPNQRYNIAAGNPPSTAGGTQAWVNTPSTFPVVWQPGYQFTYVGTGAADTPDKATLLYTLHTSYSSAGNPHPGTALTGAFFIELNLSTNDGAGNYGRLYDTYFNEFDAAVSSNVSNVNGRPGSGKGYFTFGIEPNPLAAPGANEVWLVNLNDPRAGTAVTIPVLFSQLPAGGPMDYYQGRFWVARGREYLAGDIVGGDSGTGAYEFRDAILNISENEYLAGGGTFVVPDSAGNIRALKHSNQLDTATGEGLLYVFTRESVYSVNVPPDRTTWETLAEPLQRMILLKYGTTSDNSVVPVNGDLFYQSVDGIRSLTAAIRYFGQWGNVPVSNEEALAISRNDRNLLLYGSGILFDNRLLQTCLPMETELGVVHRGLLALDFERIGTLGEKLAPAWEGIHEGLQILQVFTGDFGGRERAFAIVRSELTGGLEVWEFTITDTTDVNSFGESRVSWLVETPSYTWGDPFQLKKLETMELWIDRVFGTVEFQVWYRPSSHPCWEFWHSWTECAARSPCELLAPPPACDYPPQTYKAQYRALITMPRPPEGVCNTPLKRPATMDYSFQVRILVKGFCRIRGLVVYAQPRARQPFEGIVCG